MEHTRRYKRMKQGNKTRKHNKYSSFREFYELKLKPDIKNKSQIEKFKRMRIGLKQYGLSKFIKKESVIGGIRIFSNRERNGKKRQVLNMKLPFHFYKTRKHAIKEDQLFMTKQERQRYIVMRNKDELGGSTGTLTKAMRINPSASMSGWHQFLIINSPDAELFNILTFGIGGSFKSSRTKRDFHLMLREMKDIGLKWGESKDIPINKIGLYVHVYPENSVQSFHLHMIDERSNQVNPSNIHAMKSKNISLDTVIRYFEL